MPVIRSEYSLEQFEEMLQRFAHTIPKFEKVVAKGGETTIEFRYDNNGKPKKIHVYVRNLAFSIEPKPYLDSNHITKISFDYYGEDVDAEKRRISKWLAELMESVKPIARFSLAKMKTE
jgi:hypothetical protein